MNDWIVSLAVGIVGIAAGLAGQALYWGRFEGRVITRLEGIESDVEKLEKSRSEMWGELNSHGERLSALETACHINHNHHQNGRNHV